MKTKDKPHGMAGKFIDMILAADRPLSIRDFLPSCNSPHQYVRAIRDYGIKTYYRRPPNYKGRKPLIFFVNNAVAKELKIKDLT